jgi:hypothetical protein
MIPQVRIRRALLLVAVTALLWPSSTAAQAPPDRESTRESTKDKQRTEDACAALPEDRRRERRECMTEEERREADQQRRMKEAEQKERPDHTSFLKWVHVDGMWVPTQLGASTYGLIGSHLVVANLGRVHFYGPPGVMLLLENYGNGRRIRPALSWGISLHITDFRMPGTEQNARLFFNVAKCWTMGDQRTGMDMAGLSVTWKK